MKRQADGRYKSKVIVGTRNDGSKVTKYITAKTKRELEAKRREALVDYRDGTVRETSDVMAMDWIYKWYDTVAAPHQKKQTARDIRSQIARYIEPALADKRLRAVSYFDVQRIVNGLEGKGRTLVGNMVGVLKRSFSSACAEGIIPRDPTRALETRLPPRRSNRALSDEEILILEKSLANRATEPLLMGLLYYTGMRRGEVIGLKWGDVDLDAGIIHVRRDFDYKLNRTDRLKTANAERDIPIAAPLKEILLEHVRDEEAFVVASPTNPYKAMCEATLKRKWKYVRELLGDDVTTRTFRNNFATVLYDAGVDVLTASKVMGHADPTTTLKIYTDLERSRKVKKGNESIRAAFEK